MIMRFATLVLVLSSFSVAADAETASVNAEATVKQAAGELMGFTSAIIKALDSQEASDQAAPLTVSFAGKSVALMVKMTPLAHGESIQAIPADATASGPYQELHCVLAGEGKGSAMTIMALTVTTSDGANISGYRTGKNLNISYQSDSLHGEVTLNQADEPTLIQATRDAPVESSAPEAMAHLDWQTGLTFTVITVPHDTTPTQVPISQESP
jgi:hypothetical protein